MVTKSEFDKLNLEQIRTVFMEASKEEKVNLINVLWNNSDISKKQKGTFLLDIIKDDASLKVVTTASKKIINLYNLDFGYLELNDIISWGEKNI